MSTVHRGARNERPRMLLLLLLRLHGAVAAVAAAVGLRGTSVIRMVEVVGLDELRAKWSDGQMVESGRGRGSVGSAGVARDRDWSWGAPRGHAGRTQLASGTA